MNIFTLAFIASALVGVAAAQRSSGSASFLLSGFGLLVGLVCYFAIGWLAFRAAKSGSSVLPGKRHGAPLGWLAFLAIAASPVVSWFVVYLLAPLVAKAVGA